MFYQIDDDPVIQTRSRDRHVFQEQLLVEVAFARLFRTCRHAEDVPSLHSFDAMDTSDPDLRLPDEIHAILLDRRVDEHPRISPPSIAPHEFLEELRRTPLRQFIQRFHILAAALHLLPFGLDSTLEQLDSLPFLSQFLGNPPPILL